MGKSEFWIFINDIKFDQSVKKLLVERFVTNYLRMQHATIPRSIRNELINELDGGDPTDLLRSLKDKPSSPRLEAKKKMLRSIIATFGPN